MQTDRCDFSFPVSKWSVFSSTIYYDKQMARTVLFFSSPATPVYNLQYSPPPTLCPQEYATSNGFMSKKGRKNNLISQTVHLARQLAMFIFTFNQFTASVCSLQFPSPWIDHMWAVEVGGWKFSCRPNVLAAMAFSAWLIPFLLPSSTHRAFRVVPSLSATICYSYCISHAWRKWI